jgi:hypothetical protein
VFVAKTGLSVPLLRASDDSVATLEMRVIEIVYIVVALPSSDVISTLIWFKPTTSGIEELALPEVVVIPFTLTEALG